MSLLDSVEDFRGLYGLSEEELGALCAELRERILDVTLKNGGHLSSSLGAVELTADGRAAARIQPRLRQDNIRRGPSELRVQAADEAP